jgi:hypothetical protein
VFGEHLVERLMTQWRSGSVAGHACVLARVVLVVASATLFAAYPGAASAQGTRAQVAPTVWQAPVGHRQPRPDELPPSERKNEGAFTPAEKDLDKSLKICRGC